MDSTKYLENFSECCDEAAVVWPNTGFDWLVTMVGRSVTLWGLFIYLLCSVRCTTAVCAVDGIQ